MQKGMKMIHKERDLITMIFGNPREHRKTLLYFSVSVFCVGLVVLFRIIV
jgi:hypothetical protein